MDENTVLRHGWLVFVVVTTLNALILRVRSRSRIRERPALAPGYHRLFLGILIWENLPWLVMGIGIELGGVPTMFSYFNPGSGNPFILAWYAVIAGLWSLGFYWLFFRGGAAFLVEHPGVFRIDLGSPTTVKVWYCALVGIAISAIVFTIKFGFFRSVE